MPTLTWKSSIEGSLAVHNVLILFKKYKKEGTVICFLLNIFVLAPPPENTDVCLACKIIGCQNYYNSLNSIIKKTSIY